MQVSAFSNPRSSGWRWRISDYAGAILAESRSGFPSISAAVSVGTKRLLSLGLVDHSAPPPRSWTSRRGRAPVKRAEQRS